MWPLEQNVILHIGLGTSYFDTCWNCEASYVMYDLTLQVA